MKKFDIDSTIKLSKVNFIKNKQSIFQLLSNEINLNTTLHFIPQFNYEREEESTKQPIKKESLSEYYTNRTKLLRGL